MWIRYRLDLMSCVWQRDFLSMELMEGRVRLTFDLGSGALILTSNRKYNTGVWYKITLQRNKRKGTTNTVLMLEDCSSTAVALHCAVDFTVDSLRLNSKISQLQ